MSRKAVIDAYFLEHRAKLIDVASYLDRIDRTAPSTEGADFREAALANAIAILSDGQPNRAQRILELLSDHSTELPQSADGMKGASGAPLAGGAA